jgi:hypothetical protein
LIEKREKLQEKLDDIRDEFKKMKLKLKTLENENNDLQKELIETKNQLKYGQYNNKNSDSESKVIGKKTNEAPKNSMKRLK